MVVSRASRSLTKEKTRDLQSSSFFSVPGLDGQSEILNLYLCRNHLKNSDALFGLRFRVLPPADAFPAL